MTICLVLAAKRPDIVIADLPCLFREYAGHVYADDLWDMKVPDADAAAHAKVGLDSELGGVVVVRPDGHVGCVVGLVEGKGTVEALEEYFGGFVVARPEGCSETGTDSKGKANKEGTRFMAHL